MSRLITRAPWTRQPQTPVPLSNLARSLGFTNAWNFSDWTQNLGNPANSVTTSVNATKSIGPGGRALTFSGTAGDRLEIANDPFATSVGTYLWIESGVDVSASGQAITVSRYGAAGLPELQGLQLRIVGSDFLIIAASAAVNLTATAARNNAGSVNVTAASINGGTGRHAVVSNGALIASGNGSTAYVHGTSAIGGGPDVPMGSIKLYSLFFAPVVIADAILEKLTAEPGQLFAPLSRTIWAPAAGGGGVSGTLATTNANDTSAASGSPVVVGTLATTNANDSVVASGDVGGNITGTVNYTNANDTGAASGTTTVTGSLATTNANDSASASGTTTVTGTSAYTNANDSVAASGAAGTVTGTVNVTNSNDTADAYGIGAPNNDSGDGSMSRKRYYLRRKGKILLFDTAAQADDYIEAEEEAQKAITAAKSRGAKKRIAAKILKAVEPVESVEIAPLQELVKAYSVPVNLPQLLSQQDYSQVMDVRAMIQRIQDDEDDELLLLLA